MLLCHSLTDFIVYLLILFISEICSHLKDRYEIILNMGVHKGHLIFLSSVFLKLYTRTEETHTPHFTFKCTITQSGARLQIVPFVNWHTLITELKPVRLDD